MAPVTATEATAGTSSAERPRSRKVGVAPARFIIQQAANRSGSLAESATAQSAMNSA